MEIYEEMYTAVGLCVLITFYWLMGCSFTLAIVGGWTFILMRIVIHIVKRRYGESRWLP